MQVKRNRSGWTSNEGASMSPVDSPEEATIVRLMEQAIAALKEELPPLSFGAVHERAIAHRLAVHMEGKFRGWNVDCEYDRSGSLLKELAGIKDCDDQKKTDRVFPDIIVHHRRQSGRPNNLLVVEMKVHNGEDACDRKKLELMTATDGGFQYQLGLFINVNQGEFMCTWFRDGRKLTAALKPS